RAEAEVLGALPLRDPAIPLLSDHDGGLVDSAGALRALLLDSFDHPIDWPRVVDALESAGTETVYLTGPDALLHRSSSTRRLRVVAVSPKSALDTLLRPVRAG
ncbi:MAG: ACP S-malonyltransferase, partial [Acidimicrobiales bacterium]